MNLGDKMSYLRGMIDGMELDLTTSKEGKVLAQLLEVMQESGFVCNGFTGSGG